MTLNGYNDFCDTLPETHHVVQWGGADVWKVGGKLFAMAREKNGAFQVTFKVTDTGYEIMRDMPGLRPAPYLASRGMKWIQHFSSPGLNDDALKEHICLSYDMAVKRLTKVKRKELGLT